MEWKEGISPPPEHFFLYWSVTQRKKKKLIIVLNVQNAMSTKSPMLISTSN